MKHLLTFVLAALLTACASLAPRVACADDTAVITWVNPSTYTDSSPFTSLCCTNITRNGLFLTQVKGALTTYTDTGLSPGTYCYALQTVSSKSTDVASAYTPQVCKTIVAVVNCAPPTNVSVK